MMEKEILEKIFEFETYCTQSFDSEHRVAMAVYDYVKQMKREFRLAEMIRDAEKDNMYDNEK
jgi:hypothetical protein